MFATCTVEYNDPAIGRAAVAVLEHNGIDVSVPAQRCCGMPYLDGGAVDQCKALMRENVRTGEPGRNGTRLPARSTTRRMTCAQPFPGANAAHRTRRIAPETSRSFAARTLLQDRVMRDSLRELVPVAVSLSLVATSALAHLVPAARATRVPPTIALRGE